MGSLAVVSGAIVCGILGFLAGTLIGGNYAQNFTFLDVRGYEAAGLLGLIIGATTGGLLHLRLILTHSIELGEPSRELEERNASYNNE
jgi:hypothetical protein